MKRCGRGRRPSPASVRYGPLQLNSCCFEYVVHGLICSRALYVGARLDEELALISFLPAAVPLSHACGVSLTQFWTFLPCSSLIATAAPAPPIVAGFVTATPLRPLTASSCLRNWLLSAPTTGTYGLPAVLNALTIV